MISKFGFVYLWWDTKRNRYYLGSHLGSKTDGYTGSNRRFKSAYKSRPQTFRRRILAEGTFTHKELLKVEQHWLQKIDDLDLGNRYYNEKKVASGGDIVSTLPEEKRKLHKERSIAARKAGKEKWIKKNPDKLKAIALNARASWTDSSYDSRKKKISKEAIITTPNGDEIRVKCIKDFCDEYGLNYGNMKSVLRGNTNRKSVKGYGGKYV